MPKHQDGSPEINEKKKIFDKLRHNKIVVNEEEHHTHNVDSQQSKTSEEAKVLFIAEDVPSEEVEQEETGIEAPSEEVEQEEMGIEAPITPEPISYAENANFNLKIEELISKLGSSDREKINKKLKDLDDIKTGFNSLEQQLVEQIKVLLELSQIQEIQHEILEEQTRELKKHLRNHNQMILDYRRIKTNVYASFDVSKKIVSDIEKTIVGLKDNKSKSTIAVV